VVRSVLRTIIGLGILLFLILAVVFFSGRHNESSSSGTSAASPIATAPTGEETEYHESNEVITPFALSKNPYKWKGRSGILDTVNVPILMGSSGVVVTSVRYPGGSLKFEKMIDEHTATYSVLVDEGEVVADGEIAVILPDSDPPDPSRPWRVLVEGPMEGSNGFGATL
jgi:hypothetical protein